MTKKHDGAGLLKPHRTVTITKKMVIEGTTNERCSPCSEGLRRFRPVTISTDPEADCNVKLALRIAENENNDDDDRAGDMAWGLEHWFGADVPATNRWDDHNAVWYGEDPMQIQQRLAALADHILTARGR